MKKQDIFKKYFKLIGIPFIIALGIFLYIKFIWLKEFEFKNMSVDEYVTFYNSNKEGVIYITKDDAIMKSEFESAIATSFSDKKIDVYMINLSKQTNNDKQKFIDVNEFDEEQFVIPMMVYVKDGKVVNSILGYAPEYVINTFITDNNIE